MPAGRCAFCNFLCNPDLFGCSETFRPCPKGRVYYCGQLCQSEDAEKHRTRFHRPEDVVVCRHFLRGHCAYGDKCWKQHPSNVQEKRPSDRGGTRASESTFGYVPRDINESAHSVENLVSASGTWREGSLDGDTSIYSVIMETLESGKKCPVDNPVETGRRLDENHPDETPKKLGQRHEFSSTPILADASPVSEEGTDSTLQTMLSDGDHLVEGDSPVDASSAKSFSKKSRLEMKREARKSKKAARKRGFPSGMSLSKDEKTEDEEEENIAVQEVEAVTEPTSSAQGNVETETAAEAPTTVSSDLDSGASSPSYVQVDTDDADAISRRLTKKEKKREERRIQNIMKKKEKIESKLMHASMEYTKGIDRAKVLLKDKKHLECAVELTKLEALNDGEFELFAMRRECYLSLGKVKNALKDAVQVARLTRSEEDILALLRLQLAMGKIEEAEQTVKSMASLPDREETLLQSIIEGMRDVEEALNTEDWVKAMDLATKLESDCPSSERLHIMKAEAQLHLHIHQEAKTVLNRYKQELKSDEYYVFVSAVATYYTNDWWQSDESEQGILEVFNTSQNLFPRAAKIHGRAQTMKKTYRSVQLLMKNNRKSRAKTMLKTCIALDPNNLSYMADIHCLLASLHDQNDERLKDLNLSLRLKETYKAYIDRGNVYRSKRKYEEALLDFEHARRLKPDCPIVQNLIEQTQRYISASHRRELSNVKNDLYAILGVGHNASTDEIKKAFRLKAKEFHPDKHSAASADQRAEMERKMKAVNKAYRVLKDQRQREIYDRQRKRSASSDVDLDFSDEDYECYDSSDDDPSADSPDLFSALFFKYFMQNMNMHMSGHGSASPPSNMSSGSGRARGGSN